MTEQNEVERKRGPQRSDPATRFWPKVAKTASCWIWIANTRTVGGPPYGRFFDGDRMVQAHRFSYQISIGPIPDGHQIDHLCRNTLCVRPDHLEPVTQRENVLRGFSPIAINARKKFCLRGHKFTEENTVVIKTSRYCRACFRERYRVAREKRNEQQG
jgi:hypothetical protein